MANPHPTDGEREDNARGDQGETELLEDSYHSGLIVSIEGHHVDETHSDVSMLPEHWRAYRSDQWINSPTASPANNFVGQRGETHSGGEQRSDINHLPVQTVSGQQGLDEYLTNGQSVHNRFSSNGQYNQNRSVYGQLPMGAAAILPRLPVFDTISSEGSVPENATGAVGHMSPSDRANRSTGQPYCPQGIMQHPQVGFLNLGNFPVQDDERSSLLNNVQQRSMTDENNDSYGGTAARAANSNVSCLHIDEQVTRIDWYKTGFENGRKVVNYELKQLLQSRLDRASREAEEYKVLASQLRSELSKSKSTIADLQKTTVKLYQEKEEKASMAHQLQCVLQEVTTRLGTETALSEEKISVGVDKHLESHTREHISGTLQPITPSSQVVDTMGIPAATCATSQGGDADVSSPESQAAMMMSMIQSMFLIHSMHGGFPLNSMASPPPPQPQPAAPNVKIDIHAQSTPDTYFQALARELETLRQKNTDLSNECGEMRMQMHVFMDEKEELDILIRQDKENTCGIKNEKTNLEEEIRQIRKDRDKLMQALADMDAEKSRYEKEYTKLGAENTILLEQIAEVNEYKDRLEDNTEHIYAEGQRLQQENKEIGADKRQLENVNSKLQADNDKLLSDKQTLERKYSNIVIENETIMAHIAEISHEKELLDDQIWGLNHEEIHRELVMKRLTDAHEKEKNRLQAKLEDEVKHYQKKIASILSAHKAKEDDWYIERRTLEQQMQNTEENYKRALSMWTLLNTENVKIRNKVENLERIKKILLPGAEAGASDLGEWCVDSTCRLSHVSYEITSGASSETRGGTQSSSPSPDAGYSTSSSNVNVDELSRGTYDTTIVALSVLPDTEGNGNNSSKLVSRSRSRPRKRSRFLTKHCRQCQNCGIPESPARGDQASGGEENAKDNTRCTFHLHKPLSFDAWKMENTLRKFVEDESYINHLYYTCCHGLVDKKQKSETGCQKRDYHEFV